MHTLLDMDEVSGPAFVSTGHLPPAERVDTLLGEAYERFKSVDEGKVADYIPALAGTPRHLFAVCVVETNGALHATGDTDYEFSIQSVSKPFVFALVCQAAGEEEARKKLGVNATGLPFNSVMAIELEQRPDDEPDGERRRNRHDQSAVWPPAPPRRPNGDSSKTGCPGSPAASSPSTPRSTSPRPPPTFATTG